MKEELSVLNGEVVYRKTGKKARGNYKIKYGKKKISILKVTKRHPQGEFIGYSKKMTKTVEQKAVKYQQTRRKREARKNLRQSGLTKFAKEEYERNLIRKSTPEQEVQTEFRKAYDEDEGKISRESIRDIGRLKRSGDLVDFDPKTKTSVAVIFPRDTQNMINFERILTAMEQNGVLSLDKINNMVDESNQDMFLEDGIGVTSTFGKHLPALHFDSISEFTNWLFRQYRDGDSNKRNELWDMLHSLYPEQGFTYNPLSL